ncbi:UNVERIFIED_CONTAM: hypothetical protein K2H54_024238 [Gekko kuhli]
MASSGGSGRRGREPRAAADEEELPVYLARPGTADQVPRQKYGGMFCSVEGAFESKTLDFGALSVGQRGARRPPPQPPEQPPAGAVEIRAASGKERLQNLGREDYKKNKL